MTPPVGLASSVIVPRATHVAHCALAGRSPFAISCGLSCADATPQRAMAAQISMSFISSLRLKPHPEQVSRMLEVDEISAKDKAADVHGRERIGIDPVPLDSYVEFPVGRELESADRPKQ